MSSAALALAAESLVGVPFRMHGRDPQHGLDCVGLLEVALRRIGRAAVLPRHYSLRVREPFAWLPDPAELGFVIAGPRSEPGDVLLVRPGPMQAHVMIVAADGAAIHAHAGLRRVVKAPFDRTAPIIARWRLAEDLD
jgi:cell wall-associated NlpC family hydrolase